MLHVGQYYYDLHIFLVLTYDNNSIVLVEIFFFYGRRLLIQVNVVYFNFPEIDRAERILNDLNMIICGVEDKSSSPNLFI